MQIRAMIFDMDGVLIDSEGVWDTARRNVAREHGGHWSPIATRAMIGMSSIEWSTYMHDELEVSLPAPHISDAVVAQLKGMYTHHLPLLPGAQAAVRSFARDWPLGPSTIA